MRVRVLPALVGLLVVGSVLTACGSGPTGAASVRSTPTTPGVASAVARTVVHTFTAYRADGTPTVASARTGSGYCWDSSLAATGLSAFRCFAGAGSSAQILDPCFAPATPHPASVICVQDPWSSATTLHLTRALPTPVADGSSRPWAVELTGGTRCVASTGTVPTVGGVNLSYHCADGTAAALTQTTTALWSAVYADPDATVLHTSTVAGAWRT